jgi:UDP-glucose 4-epimerase
MTNKKQTVLVTGGLGYIGSHVVVELLNQYYNVIVIDNLSNSHIKTIDSIEKITNKNITFFQYDITKHIDEIKAVFKDIKINIVIHCAGLKSVEESTKNPSKYYNVNLRCLLNLVDIMREFKCFNLVFSSSATVYGTSINNTSFNEQSQTGQNINSPYGKTKYFQEEILKDICNADLNFSVIILRYFNPIGEHHSGLLSEASNSNTINNLFPLIVKVARTKTSELIIYGNDYETKDGTCVRDYISIIDLANAHLAVLAHFSYDKRFQVYNVGTGKGTTVIELITAFEKVNNIKIPYKFANRRNGDVDIIYANCDLIKKTIGWNNEISIEDACKVLLQ